MRYGLTFTCWHDMMADPKTQTKEVLFMTRRSKPVVGIMVSNGTPTLESRLLVPALLSAGISAFGPFTVASIFKKDFLTEGMWQIPGVMKVTPDHFCIIMNTSRGMANSIDIEKLCERLQDYSPETTFTILWQSSRYESRVFDYLLKTQLATRRRLRLVDLDTLLSENTSWDDIAHEISR